MLPGMTPTTTPAITHVALTVSDLERSVAWYTGLFRSPPVAHEDTGTYRFAVWLQPPFGLHCFPDPTEGTFDERRPGLDHVAFGCADRAELESWCARLDQLGIARGEILDEWYGSGLSFRDPDGIALELFAPPARADP
jgi:catechol 2,3-dioxygenase-like lactoylglutathione lyase family enzyme